MAAAPHSFHEMLLQSRVEANKTSQPLFDVDSYVRHLEDAYAAMWQCYLEGRAPQALEIGAA